MSRELQPGENGTITFRQTPDGWAGRTRLRLLDETFTDLRRQGPTRIAVRHALEDAIRDRLAVSGGSAVTARTTLRDATTLWLGTLEQAHLSPSSRATYAKVASRYVLGVRKDSRGRVLDVERMPLAHLTLDAITPAAITTALFDIGVRFGPGSGKTLHTLYRHVFDLAVQHRVLSENPATLARYSPAAVKEARGLSEGLAGGARALTHAEQEQALQWAASDPRHVSYGIDWLMRILAGTGVRISEACALTWADVTPDLGQLHVPAIKTEARTIYPARWLTDELTARKPASASMQTGPITASVRGGHREVTAATKAVSRAFTRAGIPWATSHTFRRTVATRMDEQGFTAREIADHLGHKQISMTQNHYLGRGTGPARAALVL